MKMSFRNQKCVVSMIVSLFIVLIPHGISYAQDPAIDPPLSERTPQIVDAIVAAVSGVDNADDVTATHLANIEGEFFLSRNSIYVALNAGDFNGLSSLEEINLDFNGLTHFEENTFAGLTSLEVLSLNRNSLTGLHKSIFDDLGKLKTLVLDGNLLGLGLLESRHFAALSELEDLLLAYNQLTELPDDVFDGLTELIELTLDFNRLTTLKDSSDNVIFADSTKLEYIDLNNNELSSLPDDVFDGLTELRSITLHGNPFDTLPDGVFEGKTKLLRLTLPDGMRLPISLEKVGTNQVKVVARTGAPFDIEVPLTVTVGRLQDDTTSVRISKGSVESDPIHVHRPTHSFRAVTVDIGTLPSPPPYQSGYALEKSGTLPLEVISRLDLPSGHPLAGRTPQVVFAIAKAGGIDPEAVTAANLADIDLTRIETLNLVSEEITALTARDFNGLTSLQLLILSDNLLTSLPKDAFSGLTSLQVLTLNDNLLTSLPKDAFSGLTSLQLLTLSNNLLTSLPKDVFSGLTSLRTLHLIDNLLTSLPVGVFAGLTALTKLHLYENPLSSIPDDAFKEVSKLEWLWLPNDLSLLISLEKVGNRQFQAVAPTGAPFEIVVPLIIENGTIPGASTDTDGNPILTIPAGSVESDETLTVTRTPNAIYAVTVKIGMETEEEVEDEFFGEAFDEAVIEILPSPPQWFHQGYKLTAGPRLVFTELGGIEPPTDEEVAAGVGAPAFTEHPNTVVDETALLSNYPNPFNPETWIPYQLAEAGNVTVTIYDIRGIVIRQLVVGHQPMGNYRSRSRAVHWDGRNQFGEKVATGLYFYTLKAGDFTATRKMLVYK